MTAWTITAAPSAAATTSARAIASPATQFTPSMRGACAGLRFSAFTFQPCATSLRATSPPIPPVAPSTSQLQPYAESLAATASAFLRAASSDSAEARGTVRITASEMVGCEVLPPILAKLNRDYPGIKLELALTNKNQDLLRREADIAVRMVRPTQEALIARRASAIELGLHAHRDYLEQRGTPATLDDLRHHALIGFDHESAFIRSMKHHLGGLTRDHFSLRSDSDVAQMAAIRAAYGIGICQCALARRDPSLVRVLPAALSIKLDTWIAMHEDLRDSKRCSVVFGALTDGIRSYIKG